MIVIPQISETVLSVAQPYDMAVVFDFESVQEHFSSVINSILSILVHMSRLGIV